MIFTYDYFIDKLNHKIKSDDSFVYELLVTVVKNPNRYTGIFRLSNAKTKLIQNVTQSREIKFGDFMEDIVTEYISKMGYRNLDKSIGHDEEGNALSADQVFMKGDTVYLIEQKIRDDHDSTKKRGQFQNFKKKYSLLKKQYPNYKINATMWFIDDSLVKNKNYYSSEAAQEIAPNISLNIYYGGTLFENLFNREDVWDEICSYLLRNKQERSNELLNIPDFDTSPEILIALRRLKTNEPALFRKLKSSTPTYVQLRKELFPTETNLKKV
ncbi:MAG: restriction endonuclease [Clostridia bacterium]|nr:restriction endonuclease [Clostridia bacterium]